MKTVEEYLEEVEELEELIASETQLMREAVQYSNNNPRSYEERRLIDKHFRKWLKEIKSKLNYRLNKLATMQELTHEDVLGNPIAIGDCVLWGSSSRYATLTMRWVVKINNKSITVTYKKGGTTGSSVSPKSLVVVNKLIQED